MKVLLSEFFILKKLREIFGFFFISFLIDIGLKLRNLVMELSVLCFLLSVVFMVVLSVFGL